MWRHDGYDDNVMNISMNREIGAGWCCYCVIPSVVWGVSKLYSLLRTMWVKLLLVVDPGYAINTVNCRRMLVITYYHFETNDCREMSITTAVCAFGTG